MKAFYIIIIACTVLISGIAVNRSYVSRFTEEARVELNNLEFDMADAEIKLSVFAETLKSNIKKTEFSISRDKNDSINDYLSLMKSQLKIRSKEDFEHTKTLLDNLLKQIGELEEISLSNLF